MPMTQADIRAHYESHWKERGGAALSAEELCFSSPIEDRVAYPIYTQVLRDLRVGIDGGSVLDVGCGSGRWVRYFLENYKPTLLRGMDITESSVKLLERFHATQGAARLEFRQADITQADLPVDRRFDCINIANVLFHIPEQALFEQALVNLKRLLAPGGRILTTEYLPRTSMRTEWMLVRDRYQFEQSVAAAGLKIAHIRAFGFFANDPMGLDGPDSATRGGFHRVRSGIRSVLNSKLDDSSRRFFLDFFSELENTLLSFCRERIADIDLPSQKLVVLAHLDE